MYQNISLIPELLVLNNICDGNIFALNTHFYSMRETFIKHLLYKYSSIYLIEKNLRLVILELGSYNIPIYYNMVVNWFDDDFHRIYNNGCGSYKHKLNGYNLTINYIKFFYDNNYVISPKYMNMAIRFNDINSVKYLYTKFKPRTSWVELALEVNFIDGIEFFISKGLHPTENGITRLLITRSLDYYSYITKNISERHISKYAYDEDIKNHFKKVSH